MSVGRTWEGHAMRGSTTTHGLGLQAGDFPPGLLVERYNTIFKGCNLERVQLQHSIQQGKPLNIATESQVVMMYSVYLFLGKGAFQTSWPSNTLRREISRRLDTAFDHGNLYLQTNERFEQFSKMPELKVHQEFLHLQCPLSAIGRLASKGFHSSSSALR